MVETNLNKYLNVFEKDDILLRAIGLSSCVQCFVVFQQQTRYETEKTIWESQILKMKLRSSEKYYD